MDHHLSHAKRKAPRRRDDCAILHFDLDCFYAQCVEYHQPALKALPLGIKQKSILATCNYEARRRGVKKLMLIADAKKLCPELVIVEGEDLTPFRNVSKKLYALLRAYSWNGKIERLGLDEMFLDVTDMVAYNLGLLNRNAVHESFFCLSRTDPEKGFAYDASSFAGCVHGDGEAQVATGTTAAHESGRDSALYMRLLLASHLARYLRLKIEEEGFTSACGISTNKLLAKLAGNKHKPRNQTTLLALREDDVFSFMDEHRLRKVPGIGSKITRVLEAHVLGHEPTDHDVHTMECVLTVGEVRNHPTISPPVLEKLFGGPGSEKGLGAKVWGLLHGVDDAEVKPARDVPTQISIEDTYRGLNEPAEIHREMLLLTASLLRRMHIDLVEDEHEDDDSSNKNNSNNNTQNSSHDLSSSSSSSSSRKWTAYPKTIRLTTRPKTTAAEGKPYNWARASRSGPIPGFVFSSAMTSGQIVERLVSETLLPMFYKLNPKPERRGWNIGLINVCVANMTGIDGGGVASGRDIATMFRRQEEVLREFTAYDGGGGGNTSSVALTATQLPSSLTEGYGGKNRNGIEISETRLAEDVSVDDANGDVEMSGNDDDDNVASGSDTSWDHDLTREEGMEQCPLCGHFLPRFALAAHDRYHSMEYDKNVDGSNLEGKEEMRERLGDSRQDPQRHYNQ